MARNDKVRARAVEGEENRRKPRKRARDDITKAEEQQKKRHLAREEAFEAIQTAQHSDPLPNAGDLNQSTARLLNDKPKMA